MTSSSIDDALDVRYRCVETTTRRDEDSNARETSTVATRDFERARALMARVGRRGACDARTIVEDASTGDGLARTIAAAAKRGMERGEDCATIFARGAGDDDADAARAVREMGAVAMVVDAMVESCEGIDRGKWEVSATCVGWSTRERAGGGAVDLLDDASAGDEGAGVGRGMTVVHVERAEDGVVTFESAMACADEVFREGASTTGRHAVFTLRLKLWAEATTETDDESGLANEPTVTRVHFVFLAPYVPAPGAFDGRDSRSVAARIECTKSTTAMMAVLRGLRRNQGQRGTTFRNLNAWRESPLTRLMWASGMSELRSAMLIVLCSDALRYAVEGDETSPLVLAPGTEGALKFALQLKEHSDDGDPAPRTRAPPVPTPTKNSNARGSGRGMKTLRAEAPPSTSAAARQRQPTAAPPATQPNRASDVAASTNGNITNEQIDAIVRVIRTHSSGLAGRRMESTIRNLSAEWTRMASAHETILEEFSVLEDQLLAAQTREDEAVQYAEQVAADLAVTSRWCETLEAEQASAKALAEKAAKDAARVAETRAVELENRIKELELELLRNSVPEMERTRDEAEKAAREAREKYQEAHDQRESALEALENETAAKRELMEQVATLQRQLEDVERVRANDRAEIDRTREELRARYQAEKDSQDRFAKAQREHELELKTAREAVAEREDQLIKMRRDRDDVLHKLHLKEEEVVEARANMRASLLNVEALQTATNEAKETRQASNKELEDLRLCNSDLLVQVKHAKRELEDTSVALNKLTEKLQDLEDGSESAIRKRREAEDEIHDLKHSIIDLEAKNKALEMDREVAYQAADVARTENAKVSASVLDLTEEVARLKSALVAAQDSTRALLDEEAARLQRLAPTVQDSDYVSPAWLHDNSWQQPSVTLVSSSS